MSELKSIQCYARDRWEVQSMLLDKGFREAATIMDTLPAAQIEAILGAAMTVQSQREHNKGRGYKPLCLLQRIRQEKGWSLEDFRSQLASFAKTDLSNQRREWRESQDSFAKTALSENDYRIWSQSVSNFAVMSKWLKTNPEPDFIEITLEFVKGLECDRWRRETRKPGLVRLVERFFANLEDRDLSWEALLAPLGSRDPRTHLTPISEKVLRKAG